MRLSLLCVAGTVLLGCGSQGYAQAETQPADPAPLAGPAVEQVRPERLEQGLTMSTRVGMQMGQIRQLPADDMTELLRRLALGDEVDWRTRLSDRQRERLKEVRQIHQAKVGEHRKQHAERFRELRKAAGYNAKPRLPDAEVGPEVMEARIALRSLYQSGPTTADLQMKLYAELTGAQQDWIDAEMHRLLEQRSRERRERQYADELNAKPVDPSTFFRDDGTVNMALLPEGLRTQLAEIEEPRRAVRLRRILERLSRLQPGDSEADAQDAMEKRVRPLPAIDTVQVPDAESAPDRKADAE